MPWVCIFRAKHTIRLQRCCYKRAIGRAADNNTAAQFILTKPGSLKALCGLHELSVLFVYHVEKMPETRCRVAVSVVLLTFWCRPVTFDCIYNICTRQML